MRCRRGQPTSRSEEKADKPQLRMTTRPRVVRKLLTEPGSLNKWKWLYDSGEVKYTDKREPDYRREFKVRKHFRKKPVWHRPGFGTKERLKKLDKRESLQLPMTDDTDSDAEKIRELMEQPNGIVNGSVKIARILVRIAMALATLPSGRGSEGSRTQKIRKKSWLQGIFDAEPSGALAYGRKKPKKEPKNRKSFEFPSEEALREYLHIHPRADKSIHWVRTPTFSHPSTQKPSTGIHTPSEPPHSALTQPSKPSSDTPEAKKIQDPSTQKPVPRLDPGKQGTQLFGTHHIYDAKHQLGDKEDHYRAMMDDRSPSNPWQVKDRTAIKEYLTQKLGRKPKYEDTEKEIFQRRKAGEIISYAFWSTTKHTDDPTFSLDMLTDKKGVPQGLVTNYVNEDNNLEIGALASSGQVRGMGTYLLAKTIREKLKKGQKLWLSAVDTAKPFYKKIGMKPVDPLGPFFYFDYDDAKQFSDRVFEELGQ